MHLLDWSSHDRMVDNKCLTYKALVVDFLVYECGPVGLLA